MADKDNFGKDFDTLMAAMLLKSIIGDNAATELVPFKVEVTFTPTSISCHVEGNKRLLKDIEGGEEWFRETSSLIEPIMKEQTTKFCALAKKKFGFKTAETAKIGTHQDTDGFAEFMRSLFGGGKTITPDMINGLPAVVMRVRQTQNK